ncbi:MAG TPA: peptide MFS transporter [Bryobacteraceae bacterium]|nr:peptide MFS transporter [Bryobacteraceae bacterium]
MSTNVSATPPSAYDTIRTQRTILGHPAGLFVLFFTEMWERFSYYGMRALLVLYMVDYLIKNVRAGSVHVLGFLPLQRGIEAVFGPQNVQPLASQIYGMYTALVYLTPLFGGMIADRLLGQRKTVVIGAVLMAVGQFFLAAESMFLVGLFFLIVGNGCFKPNLATQVGGLYPPGDPRLDRAYSIYYMGVNLGAFFAPLVCGTLGQKFGWSYGFGAAGVGMICGLFLYLWGQKFLAEDNLTRGKKTHAEKVPLTSREWKVIIALMVLVILNALFWAVYEQQGNTLQIFADRNADWHVFGFEMPSTWFQAVNPMFIFALTPLLISFWGWQSRGGKEPGSITKMAMGCVLLGISFVPLIYIAHGLGETQKISFLWLVGSTLVLTVGELYLSPIGQSLVAQVAPPSLVSMLMGMWFLSNFIGNYFTGYLGTFYEKMPRETFFVLLGGLGLAAGLAIFVLGKPLRSAMGRKV